MGAENDMDNGVDDGFDIQDVGIVAGFLATDEEAEEESEKIKRSEEDVLDASDIGLDMADIGLEIGSFDEDGEESG